MSLSSLFVVRLFISLFRMNGSVRLRGIFGVKGISLNRTVAGGGGYSF